jgi:Na+/melibiose symporter-like transporter
MLWTYFGLQICLTLVSTVLGGLMVEVGKRDNSTGQLSAQRLGITRVVGLVSGPLGGFLSKQPFILTAGICSVLYVFTAPLYWLYLREPRSERNTGVLREMGRQLVGLFRSRTLLSAAGLVILVVIGPGFGTPLLYYQRQELKFDAQFIGSLGVISAVCSMFAAFLYSRFCRRYNLRTMLAASIILEAGMTLFYLLYKDATSAMIITGLQAATMVFALLPLYDLAARATPRGSEALGYSLMMSVWNFTSQISDFIGSWLYTSMGLAFKELVWVNSGTTILVLLAVPFLPAVLMNRRDGDTEPAVTALADD